MTVRTQGAAAWDKPEPRSRATEPTARIRRALCLVLSMLSLSLLLVVLGVYTTTRTESLDVTGYTSGAILTLGSFLGLLGLCLEENRKQLFGVVTSFLCLVIDGACIVINMDMRPLAAGRCQYYSSGSGYIYENFYTAVSCWSLRESCSMTVRSGTCYCCDLYNCANGGYLSNYYEFVGVSSCEEVLTLYVLIWTLTGLNLLAFFSGILTTAVLGSIRNMEMDVRVFYSQSSSSPAPEASERTPSPTAPQLPDANTHTAYQLHPGTAMYFPAAERSSVSQRNPPSSSLHTDSLSSPYAP